MRTKESNTDIERIKQEVINTLLSVIRSDPSKAMVPDPSDPTVAYIDWSKLSADDMKAIKSFKGKRGYAGRNANKIPIYSFDAEFLDKNAAIEKLAKVLGLYAPIESKSDINLGADVDGIIETLRNLDIPNE